uniref:Putative secreted protein n=1 Tax=Anopheles triannulatus TaxID=58253 RepID=A0A2M4B2J1_9DIPT
MLRCSRHRNMASTVFATATAIAGDVLSGQDCFSYFRTSFPSDTCTHAHTQTPVHRKELDILFSFFFSFFRSLAPHICIATYYSCSVAAISQRLLIWVNDF